MTLPHISQSPRDPDFLQDPYPFYDRARALGPLVWWEEFGLPCATTHAVVSEILRDRRFGRVGPPPPVPPAHLTRWRAIEDNSLLEMEPPDHTRLRGLVMRAFTSRQVARLEPQIEALSHELIDAFPVGDFDLLSAFCEPLPVRLICRLLGVPEDMAPLLLDWSHAMVAMYQARRDRATEEAAGQAATDFTAYLTDLIAHRRRAPGEDLLSALIEARDAADRLSEIELIATTVLLLNAGHEATVHALGNGIRTLLTTGLRPDRDSGADMAEEILRHDPPLHMFRRYATQPAQIAGHSFAPMDPVALLLGSANRDPAAYPAPDRFDPDRGGPTQVALGAGIHFCTGAPLARAEIRLSLPILFDRCPTLALAGTPTFADRYHFRGLTHLMVRR